jgi:hypothetical protein
MSIPRQELEKAVQERDEAREWRKSIQGLIFALGMKSEMTNWGGDLNGWGAAFEWIKYHVKRSQDYASRERIQALEKESK